MSKRAITIEDLLQFKLVADPHIHPIDDLVLFGLKTTDEKFKSLSHLHTVDFNGNVHQLTQGEKSCVGGKWIPQSRSVSFVSGRGTTGDQIFILPETGEAGQVTKLDEGNIGGYEWSPDGKYIAFTHRLAHPDFSENGVKERKEKGHGDAPWAFETTWYRLDGDGYFGEQRYKLYLLEVSSGKVSLLSDKSAHGEYSFAWSPFSDKLIVARSAEKDPFIAKPNEQLYILDLKGNESQVPSLPRGGKGNVKFSPDGEWIAFSGNDSVDDPWGALNTRLYKVRPNGSDYRCLTPTTDYDLDAATLGDTKESPAATLTWSPDSKTIFTYIGWHGENHLASIDAETGDVKLITSGKVSYFVGDLNTNTTRAVAIFSDPVTIPEIELLETQTGKSTRLTHFNDSWLDQVNLAPVEGFYLDSPDGTKVHTWVMKPVGFDASKKYPAVLEVHGGPHAQYGWVFFQEFQVLAAQGYVVVYTNPRGSKGYGEAHCNAIKGDWGNKDWIDVQTATDWMKAQPFIDSSRVAIMGGSYGGYMTNWAIGHSQDYKAAITDRCVSNMVSFAGNSDFPMNKDGYFQGTAYGSLDKIAGLWAQSPIAYFEGVTTPTLIIHSEGDLRCNIEQSEQVFMALKMQGVPARFVRYPRNTSHGMSRNGPADMRIHRLNEIVGWWKRYLD